MYSIKTEIPICTLLGKHEWKEISNEELLGSKIKRTFQCVHCRKTASTNKKII